MFFLFIRGEFVMTSKKFVENFLSEKSIAVVGASRNKKKFGYTVFKELKSKGYNVFPVNPNTEHIENEKCYPDLISIPGEINAALLVTPPSATMQVVKDAFNKGIKKIWMQQGSESEEAIRFCEENSIEVAYKECILMFAEPTAFFHRAHRWVKGLTGQLPK
jgi:predicted CoA-binding protein